MPVRGVAVTTSKRMAQPLKGNNGKGNNGIAVKLVADNSYSLWTIAIKLGNRSTES
jgi:hypothetical protein